MDLYGFHPFLPVYTCRAYSYIDLPEFSGLEKCSLLPGADNGFCLIGVSGRSVRAQHIKEDGSSAGVSLVLENECISFSADSARVYFTARLTAQDGRGVVRQTSVTSYDFSTGQTDIVFINGVFAAKGNRFAAGGGRFYLVDDTKRNSWAYFQKEARLFLQQAARRISYKFFTTAGCIRCLS